jgi:hypothetical protein
MLRLDKAIFKVINAYNRFALPRYWVQINTSCCSVISFRVASMKPSIKAGKITPSTILRRLGTASIVPNSATLKAVMYALKREQALMRYAHAGDLPIDKTLLKM